MVFSNHKPYGSDSSDNEEDPWEIVGDDETTPLAANLQTISSTAASDAGGEQRESQQVAMDAPTNLNEIGNDGGNESFNMVSDIEEGKEDVKKDNLDVGDGEGDENTFGEKEEASGLMEKLLDPDEELKAKISDGGEKMEAYYDEKLKRWIFPEEDLSEAAAPPDVPMKEESPDTQTEEAPEPDSPTAEKGEEAKISNGGEKMEAYYDEKLKRWIFPEEDLSEAAAPPDVPMKEESPDTQTEEAPEPDSPTAEKGEEAKISNGGEKMEAYYDEQLKRWMFPEDESAEAATSPVVPQMEEAPDTTAKDPEPDSPKAEADNTEKDDEKYVVESLTDMGFDKEQIEKAIEDLREAGTDIDEDSVIGQIAGETPDNTTNRSQAPLTSTWDFVESSVRDFDNQHEIRRRTQNLSRNVSRSAQEFWSSVKDESQRFRTNLRDTCDQADTHARSASTQFKYVASSVKDKVCRANEEHKITEKVATAAVVGGALLVALGNPRAGVGAMAVAGATVAAGEAMKHSSAHSTSTYTRDHGLSEGLHLD